MNGTHISAVSDSDYSEHSLHIIKGLSLLVLCKSLTQDRPTRLCIMLGPSDKLAIKLKLMSNLLEGMHISDLRLQKLNKMWAFLKCKVNSILFDSLSFSFFPIIIHLLKN